MKLILVFLLALVFLPHTLMAQRGSELAGPDLAPQNNVWSDTSPQYQVIAGVFDIAVIMGMNKFYQDKDFVAVSQRYDMEARRALKFQRKLLDEKKKLDDEELKLGGLKAKHNALQLQADQHNENLKSKEDLLTEKQMLLTTSEKDAEFSEINKRINQLHNQALVDHRGAYNTLDDWASALPSKDRQEFERLRDRKNLLNKMPDVTTETRTKAIKDAEMALRDTMKARDLTLSEMDRVQAEMKNLTDHIENLRPELSAAESAFTAQENLVKIAEGDMNSLVVKKGGRLARMRWTRYFGRFVFGVDLGGRVLYYYLGQKDPGVSPWIKILRML